MGTAIRASVLRMTLTEDDLKAISALMDEKIAPLRQELQSEMHRQRQEVRDDIAGLRNRMIPETEFKCCYPSLCSCAAERAAHTMLWY